MNDIDENHPDQRRDHHDTVGSFSGLKDILFQFVWEAVGLMILGFGIVYFLEKLSQKSAKA